MRAAMQSVPWPADLRFCHPTPEVVEHLHHPRRDLEQIWRCPKTGRVVGHYDQTGPLGG